MAITSPLLFGLSLVACGPKPCESEEVEVIYERSCAACHTSGAAGAPKRGDATAWAPRLAKGDEALVGSVRDGILGMPAKGLCPDCSDEHYRALIRCMSQ